MKVRNLIPTAALCCVAASRVAAVPFKVYVLALYLEQPTTDAQAAITTDEEKLIVISMLRDLSREEFVQAVDTAIMRNSSADMPILRARIDLLENALPEKGMCSVSGTYPASAH